MPAAPLPWELHPCGGGGRAGWEQMGSELCLLCVVPLLLLPYFHRLPAFVLWGINPGLSWSVQAWVSLARAIAGACSGEQPQPDPRSLNQQQVLPVTDWSVIGLKTRWIRKPAYKKDRNKENIYAKLVLLQFLNFIKFSLSVVLQSWAWQQEKSNGTCERNPGLLLYCTDRTKLFNLLPHLFLAIAESCKGQAMAAQGI